MAATFALVGCGGVTDADETVQETLGGALSGAAAADDADYLPTPLGLRVHKTCIHEVPDEADVDEQENVNVRGRFHRRLGRCAFAPRRNPTVNGWAAYSALVAPTNPYGFNWYTQISVDFVVPSTPSSNSGQLVYLFPAMEPRSANSILQPVLQYGVSPAGGGYFWAMANWYVTAAGNVVHSPLVSVVAGDQIRGFIYRNRQVACSTNGTGCRWVVSYGINGAPVGTKYIHVTSPDSYQWAAQGALEVYGVTSCSQLPRTDTTFTRRSLYEPGPTMDQAISVTGTFSRTITPGLSPACGYQVNNTPTSTTLVY